MLSTIQRRILCLALKKRFITTGEILSDLWGWQPGAWGSKKATVGEAAYKSAHASLSRCLTRLWLRGLIEYWKNLTRHRTGITLTNAGETLARAILTEAENKES